MPNAKSSSRATAASTAAAASAPPRVAAFAAAESTLADGASGGACSAHSALQSVRAGRSFDFDVAAWPEEPERILGALLSKRSAAFGSYGLSVGFGTFQSDQYWIGKKIKEAQSYQRKSRSKPADEG